MTLAHPVKNAMPKDENTTNRLFEKPLEAPFIWMQGTIFMGIFI
jgi:hypothetical protein